MLESTRRSAGWGKQPVDGLSSWMLASNESKEQDEQLTRVTAPQKS